MRAGNPIITETEFFTLLKELLERLDNIHKILARIETHLLRDKVENSMN